MQKTNDSTLNTLLKNELTDGLDCSTKWYACVKMQHSLAFRPINTQIISSLKEGEDKMPDRSSKMSEREMANAMKKAQGLDRVAERLLQTVDPTYADRRFMNEQDAKFQAIIDRQLDIAKGVAGNQIVDFVASIRDQNRRRGPGRPRKNANGIETADLFTENIGDIFGYFQDVYKNRYMEVSDLKFISRFIPALGEAVRIYLDAIVSSDDVKQTITRNIVVDNITDPNSKVIFNNFVEQMEDEYKLLSKLKVAYKKTLISGTFYVYHIAYRDLFALYSQGVASGRITREGPNGPGNARFDTHESEPGQLLNGPQGKMPKKPNVLGIAQEAFVPVFSGATPVTEQILEPSLEAFGDVSYELEHGMISKLNYSTPAFESVMKEITSVVTDEGVYLPRDREGNPISVGDAQKQLRAAIDADLPNIYFCKSPIPLAVADEAEMISGAIENYHDFFNLRKDIDEQLHDGQTAGNPDGTYDLLKPSAARAQNFDAITGTYLKWIDYKYIIPIEILGQKIGYYHIVTTQKTKKNNGRGGNKASEIGGILSTGSMSLFDQMNVTEKRKEAAIQNIVDTISGCILDQFSVKFVKKNAAFKQLIAECIIANGLVDNDYMIQFIPANHIIEFRCNEDENGKGESILSEAMFPAHLLLSIVVCKMLNYINKGGNRTIAHISSGKVNRSLSNQVNRVLRDLQAGNVTATDLLSSSMVFSKVTRDANIAMPKDIQGNKLVEFEVQEGQDIELDTFYETMLEKWCMIAAGMPPTLMDYQSNVDVARKVVSDNIRVAGRVAGLQADLEGPTTELYKILIENSTLDETMKNQCSTSLSFKLPRPRILANQNNSDALNTAVQNAQTLANVMYGENNMDEQVQQLKDKFVEVVVADQTPFIDWDQIRKYRDQARVLLEEEKAKKQAAGDNSQDDMGMGGGMGGMDDMGGMGDMGGDLDMGGGDSGGGMDDLGGF